MSFFLYKLAGSLVTPPGLVIVIVILLAFQAFKRPRRALLGTELLLVATCLYLLSAPATSRRLVAPLEATEASLPPAGSRAAIVVLAAGAWQGEGGERELKPHSLQRLVGAWEVARSRDWPLVVTGGSHRERGTTVARSMAQRLALWGFEGPVIVEDQSRTTWENLALAAPLFKAEKISDIVIVTHAYHMRRALLSAGKTLKGLTLHGWPVGRLADRIEPTPLDWLPDAGALFQSCLALREQVGLLAYQIYP